MNPRAVLVFYMVGALAGAGRACLAQSHTARQDAYRQLDAIRAEKKKQLTAYFERIHHLARTIRQDEVMIRYFQIKRRYVKLSQKAPPPAETVRAINHLKQSLREHYMRHYLAFYDLLFVDREGMIFSTIRQESDYRKNVFEGTLSKTSLSRRLKQKPEEAFVDFEYYHISDEPSAFFVEPVIVEQQHLGWFVLQCSINKINDIFIRGKGLGQTDEVFLVNENHHMLTDSRFRADSSILKQHLSAENIRGKFAEQLGRKKVIDYRGYPALTSFEVCPVLGHRWLLIAKMDEDEVLTRAYRERREQYRPRLVESVKSAGNLSDGELRFHDPPVVVDIDEYHRSNDGRDLVTFGVHTCTAVLICLPGEFCYMGHASNYDCIYGKGDLDLVGHMLKRICRFEIPPYKIRRLEVVIVAPHKNSIAGLIDKLTDAGLFLSQITFLYNEQARTATVWHGIKDHLTQVEWVMENQPTRLQGATAAPSLGTVFEGILDATADPSVLKPR